MSVVRIDIEVTEEIKEEAEWLAKSDGISVSSLLRRYIRTEYQRRIVLPGRVEWVGSPAERKLNGG